MSNKSLVPFIKGQIPPHISDSNTLLVPFMEAYYEWMHLDGNNYDLLNSLSDLHDIDKSLVKFADEFKNEYLNNFPKDFLTDKSLTIKHINDLYKAKGTPSAVKLLIKMILGKESEIYYPSSQILKASDGDWIQENSILVKIISGDIFDIVGESVKIATSELTFSSVVERVKLTDTANVYEVFLERKLVYDITKNTIVSYKNVVLQSLETVTSYNILKAGSGFKVGQLFEIVSTNGGGGLVKVKSLTDAGGIKALQIIKFGYNYESDFISTVTNKANSPNLLIQFPNLSDTLDGIVDEGTINEVDYFVSTYADGTYVGKILRTFKSGASVEVDNTMASIRFNLGSKLKYPGYYNSNRGFLSDSIFIQDSFYYQIYSYVIKIDEVLNKYKTQIENTVHPAGLKLFGEYQINNSFELNTQLNFILSFFRLVVSDSAQALDSLGIALSKILSDSASSADTHRVTFTKELIDSISVADASLLTFTKELIDSISVADASLLTFTKQLIDSITLADSPSFAFTKQLIDSITLADASLLTFTKELTESLTTSDGIASFAFTKQLTESLTTSDGITSFAFTKQLIDSISPDDNNLSFILDKYISDNQITSDTGYLYLNYYTGIDYWEPSYSIGATQF